MPTSEFEGRILAGRWQHIDTHLATIVVAK
jgi:hypothetical protein